MVSVGSRELKNRLGKYLKLVKAGETIEITDRGEPVGRILPVEKSGEEGRLERLAELLAKGGVKLPAKPFRRRLRPVKLKPGPSIAEMIREGRR